MGGVFSSRPKPTTNHGNHHISWFNSTFEKAEKTLNQLTNELFDNGNSEINVFNSNTIFNVIETLSENINLLDHNNNHEARINLQRNKNILNYLFKLYSTQLTRFQNYDLNNFSNLSIIE